ncbi:MAG: magnesium transporter mgtE [Nitrospira sp. OLB3]|nr:MAG: magnesium transporter mgtE [Nitrospira sp. OLB3]RIK58463.1 MAG: magnesium transporter [Nitrospira sp.]
MPTAADLMTALVPRAGAEDTVAAALANLRGSEWSEVGHLYLVDAHAHLVGQVPIERLLIAPGEQVLESLRGDPPIEVRAGEDAEVVALLAVERHDADVAVTDTDGVLLGAIPIGRLLAQLHDEHVDDLLRMGGLGAKYPAPTAPPSAAAAFRARIPWLVVGLAGGMLAGGVAAAFEEALRQEIALAFFLPLVVYMADAVGTQTETVLVRALAYGHVDLTPQLLREGLVGLLLGGAIGALAGVTFLWFDGRGSIALVVAVTLGVTAVVATIVASLLPMALARLGADPALASGPVATVLQDILSVAIYLGIASTILHW